MNTKYESGTTKQRIINYLYHLQASERLILFKDLKITTEKILKLSDEELESLGDKINIWIDNHSDLLDYNRQTNEKDFSEIFEESLENLKNTAKEYNETRKILNIQKEQKAVTTKEILNTILNLQLTSEKKQKCLDDLYISEDQANDLSEKKMIILIQEIKDWIHDNK